jgi:hypothetical protein
MTITATREPMSKKHSPGEKAEAGQPGKRVTTTKVDSELMRKAKVVAAYRDVDLFEYLDGLLRSLIERDYSRIVREDN